MSELPTKKFPYSNYDVVIVEKDDILKTIDDNIIDKEVARALIDSLEIKAYEYLKEEQGVSLPYLGTIRIPDGLKRENRLRNKDAIQYAYEHFSKPKYVAFIKDMNKLNKERINFQALLSSAFEIMKKKYPDIYKELYAKNGELYAKLVLSFRYFLKPSREYYKTEIENLEEDE